MERLTCEGDFCEITKCGRLPCPLGEKCKQKKIWERLKAYEDTGMKPEEVAGMKLVLMGKSMAEVTDFDGVSIDRMKKLAAADRDGRVVVLPGKAGDHVFYAAGRMIVEYEIVRVFPTRTIGLAADRGYGAMDFYPYDIGRTVFLTREAAEAALKGADHAEE